jgi:hypothetical protein
MVRPHDGASDAVFPRPSDSDFVAASGLSPDGAAPSRGLTPAVWAFAASVVLQLVVLYWPTTPSEHGLPVDKLIHAAIFGLVMVTGAWAGVPRRPLFVVLALHAPGSELIQHYLLPHRDGDWRDATADLVGLLLGVLIVTTLQRRRG